MNWCWLLLLPPLAADGIQTKLGGRARPPWECPALPCRPPAEAMPLPGQPLPAEPGAQPPSDAFRQALASAPEAGTQPARSYAPGFFGDFVGGCVLTDVVISMADSGNGEPGFCPRLVCLPTPSQGGGYKASENDSPRPVDRFFYNYTFYGNIDVRTDVSPDAPPLQLHRHIIGFEKTLLGGDASIGMRLPFLVFAGDIGYDAAVVADLIIVTKYAFWNNRETGNLASGGLVIVAPSGGSPVFFNGFTGRRDLVQQRLFPVILQPWGGYVYNVNPRLYFHGFHSIAVPTDSRDAIVISNDVGVGWWLYRGPDDRGLQAVVPTFEVHVNTPLNHRVHVDPNAGAEAVLVDSVTLTMGCNFLLPRSILGGAVGVPITGQARIEALAAWTFRF